MAKQATATPEAPKGDQAGTTDAPIRAGEPGGREPVGPALPENADTESHDRGVFRQLSGAAQGYQPAADAEPPAPTQPSEPGGEAAPTEPAGEPEFFPTDPWLSADHVPAPQAMPEGTPAPAPKPAAQEEPGVDADAERREAELIARTALERDFGKTPMVDTMLQGLDTDGLRAVGEQAKTRQAGYDRLGNRVAELEKSIKSGGKPRGGTQEDDAGGDATVDLDNLDDLTPTQRKLVERYVDLGDTETAELHVLEFRERAESRREEPQAPAGGGGDLSMAELLVEFRAPLDILAQTYPQLADNENRQAVLETTERLMAADVFEDGTTAQDMLERAASVRFGEPDPQAAQRRLIQRNQAERNGQPNPTSKGGETPVPAMSEQEADRETFRQLAHGAGVKEANAHRQRVRMT